jgi:hypothetical protein
MLATPMEIHQPLKGLGLEDYWFRYSSLYLYLDRPSVQFYWGSNKSSKTIGPPSEP